MVKDAKPALLGLACFALAVASRVLLQRYANGPFITFYPAVILAALIGGWRSGFVCALPSFVVGLYFFSPTGAAGSIKAEISFSVAIFILSCSIAIYQSYRQERALALLESERDRSALLFQEVQHRVANNMMLVAKLLDMHRRDLPIADEAARSALREATQRIQAFGSLHRRLHDHSVAEAPAITVLDAIAKDLIAANGADHLQCEVHPSDHTLDLDSLTCVALIASEAFTNAMKYAFPSGAAGKIAIRLNRESDEYTLTIADNGIGKAKDAIPNVGVGTRVMHGLAKQLRGQLEIDSGDQGTTVSLVFPVYKGQHASL